MLDVSYTPIGVIRTPFKEPKGTPIQPTGAVDVEGTVEIFPDYAPGLVDLEGFSHIILIYHFHMVTRVSLQIIPFLDTKVRGVFATRAPSRPNPIGMSIVRLTNVTGSQLRILDVDVVDGTPLLDIKPYVPAFDGREGASAGWLKRRLGGLPTARDDGRFAPSG